jgi:CHASE2 domain-containing sensor protein
VRGRRLGPGVIIDGTYRLDALLGEGAASAVFRATHLALQKPFAVKVLLPPPGASARYFERFRAEAETLGRFTHPGVVRVTDFGVDPRGDGLPYLVMELIEGTTLAALCGDGSMPLAQAVPIVERIAAALDAAHAAGVVHGDLTMGNVMVGRGDGRIVVIDFGLARRFDGHEPAVPELLAGTPHYLSPEIISGDPPTPAGDVYAFGVLVYRALTGRYPIAGDTRSAMLDAHARVVPLPPSSVAVDLPASVDEVVLSALAKSPNDRPRSAGAMAQALSRAMKRRDLAAWRRREVPRRIAAAILLAAACTALFPPLSRVELVQRLEGITFDTRVRLSAPRAIDARLLLVSFDDRSLAADTTPLPDRAEEVGGRLARLMDAGVEMVGIDLLLPAQWGQSRAFADLVLTHAPRLALAVAQERDERVGPEAIGGLIASALGPDAARSLFASVNVEPDIDGVVRRARTFRVASDGARQPTLAARIAGWPQRAAAERFTIDYRLDRESIERISWIDLEARLRERPQSFARRLVLVGAEFAGSGDRHLAPRPRSPPSDITGLEQQAIIAATLLTPDRLVTPDGWRLGGWLAVLVVLAAGVAVCALVRAGTGRVLTTSAAAIALWAFGAMMAFLGGTVLPMAAPVTLLPLVTAVAMVWARRWSRPPQAP